MKEQFEITGRLFTYIVRYDAGTAPNPDHGMCSLAICKPSIRRVAAPGDWVVGLAPASKNNRLVYCMKVDEKISWKDYIVACNQGKGIPAGFRSDALKKRVPRRKTDLGDCIWKDAAVKSEPRPTASNHGIDDFETDVINGESVLLSKNFYYFGGGSKFNILLNSRLAAITPGRGHRSDANNAYRAEFCVWFQEVLRKHGIERPGKYGAPELRRDQVDDEVRRSCRRAEREEDELESSFDSASSSDALSQRTCGS